MMSDVQIDIAEKDAAKKTLTDEFRKCMTSLTPAESWFIQALLNDEFNHNDYDNNSSMNNDDGMNTVDAVDMNKRQVAYLTKAANKLSNEKLFSSSVVQPPLQNIDIMEKPHKARRPSNLGLWKAYEDGVHPQQLKRRGSRSINNSLHNSSIGEATIISTTKLPDDTTTPSNDDPGKTRASLRKSSNGSNVDKNVQVDDGNVDDDDDNSEIQINPVREQDDDGSSWDSQDDADHRRFDAWEILKDEYANEFGFDFTSPVPMNEMYTVDNIPNSFQILGTCADDASVQPHVMSPPMMDALMSFLPEPIIGQNYWLRYSLVRDGASLETLQRYVRATEYTIIVIETRKGKVFGSFTSTPWQNQYGFFGSTPAFVWRMRHGRQTKCSSLFDQAQLESEIDIYIAQDRCDNRIQLCHQDKIGVGGDNDNETGFALYLNSDLSRGTTSRCTTFHSPSLCGGNVGNETEIFDIAGLEVWSLTTCFTVLEAEKLEMTKFFIEESIRNLSVPRTPYNSERSKNQNITSSDDVLDPRKFYQRVGHDTDSQARRDRWEYMNTMHAVGQPNSTNSGLGASPRYGYEKTS